MLSVFFLADVSNRIHSFKYLRFTKTKNQTILNILSLNRNQTKISKSVLNLKGITYPYLALFKCTFQYNFDLLKNIKHLKLVFAKSNCLKSYLIRF